MGQFCQYCVQKRHYKGGIATGKYNEFMVVSLQSHSLVPAKTTTGVQQLEELTSKCIRQASSQVDFKS